MKGNHVLLIGYVASDLIVKKEENRHRTRLRVATHYPCRRPSGTHEWRTVWHDVVAWDKTADYAERNFVKGSRIMIEGSINYRSYADKMGHTRYITEITAQSLTNLDR